MLKDKLENFVNSQVELDPEFSNTLNENFWELVDNKPTKERF